MAGNVYERVKNKVRANIPGTAEYVFAQARNIATMGGKVILRCTLTEDYGPALDTPGKYKHFTYQLVADVIRPVVAEESSRRVQIIASGKKAYKSRPQTQEVLLVDEGKNGLQENFALLHLKLRLLREANANVLGSLEYTLKAVSRQQGRVLYNVSSFGEDQQDSATQPK